MADPVNPASGLHIDSDWKNQAQAEKQRLAEAEAKSAGPAGQGGEGELPPPDFQTLVGMIATQAVMYLGGMADRRTGAAVVDLDYAQFQIDLLATLEQKTKGNLTEAEAQDLAMLLNDLRLRFVEISRAVAQAAAQQRMGGVPGGGISGGGVMPGAGVSPAGPAKTKSGLVMP